MTFRQHNSNRAGYTLIELLEGIAAIALGAWLADKVGSHFQGVWHTIVYWTIATVGSGIIFLCFLFGFGYLFASRKHRQIQKASDGKDTRNAA